MWTPSKGDSSSQVPSTSFPTGTDSGSVPLYTVIALALILSSGAVAFLPGGYLHGQFGGVGTAVCTIAALLFTALWVLRRSTRALPGKDERPPSNVQQTPAAAAPDAPVTSPAPAEDQERPQVEDEPGCDPSVNGSKGGPSQARVLVGTSGIRPSTLSALKGLSLPHAASWSDLATAGSTGASDITSEDWCHTHTRPMSEFVGFRIGSPNQERDIATPSLSSFEPSPEAGAKEHPECTILVADCEGFGGPAAAKDPQALAALMQEVYGAVDQEARALGLTRLDAAGDGYFAAGGLSGSAANESDPGQARAVLHLACAIHECAEQVSDMSGVAVRFRIGIATGPATTAAIPKAHGKPLQHVAHGPTVLEAAFLERRCEVNESLLASPGHRAPESAPKATMFISDRTRVLAGIKSNAPGVVERLVRISGRLKRCYMVDSDRIEELVAFSGLEEAWPATRSQTSLTGSSVRTEVTLGSLESSISSISSTSASASASATHGPPYSSLGFKHGNPSQGPRTKPSRFAPSPDQAAPAAAGPALATALQLGPAGDAAAAAGHPQNGHRAKGMLPGAASILGSAAAATGHRARPQSADLPRPLPVPIPVPLPRPIAAYQADQAEPGSPQCGLEPIRVHLSKGAPRAFRGAGGASGAARPLESLDEHAEA